MSSTRPPSPAPTLPGLTVERLLGSGGFADVFLYRQERPSRQVAVKVLLENMDDGVVQDQFEAEANVMARLSSHPAIVTVYGADVESGRPYIVMEYCPLKNYGERFRTERISVQEALSVGVQIAGAVETAHRAGIFHRDIKPANILVTEYRRPALTDFGISVVTGTGSEFDAGSGMSIPWSPPEVFADPPRFDARSDVYALAATVYSLLAGRTPFESETGRNSSVDLIQRICQNPVPPLGRPDAPDELRRVLSVALSKDPAVRYPTALDFGLALQQVEQLLGYTVTSMDVLDDRPSAPVDDEDDALDAHTRIRRVTTVSPYSTTTRRPHEAMGPRGSADTTPRTGASTTAGVGLGSTHAPGSSFVTPQSGDRVPSMDGVAGNTVTGAARPSVAHAWDEALEKTVIRDGGAARSATTHRSRADGLEVPPPPSDPTVSTGVPAWVYVVLALVAVIGVGIGAMLTAQRFLMDEKPQEVPVPQSPVAVGVPMVAVNPQSELAAPAEDQTTRGRLKISWDHPETFDPEHDTYEVAWKDLPENYQEVFPPQQVTGARNSVVLTIPPTLPDLCVQIVTARDNGQKSAETLEYCPPEIPAD